MKFVPLLIACLFFVACGEDVDPAMYALESSPHTDIFVSDEAFTVDPPVAVGVDPVETSTLPDFPRWYCPDSVVNRAQAATFIVRFMYGIAPGEQEEYDGRFSDVSEANAHAGAIARLLEEEVVYGCASDAYCPENALTRGQLATYLSRVGGLAEGSGATTRHIDVPPDHPHARGIDELRARGIAVDCGPDAFCPDGPVTRDELASFLVRAKYGDTPPAVSLRGVFRDVASSNPHAPAIDVLAQERVSWGCDAPAVGYRVLGYPLSRLQRDWLLYFAGQALPRLERAYGDRQRALDVGSRAVWWSLKEGVFGAFGDPFRHSICKTPERTNYLGAFDTCSGEWQVGLVATEIPNVRDDEVHAAASALYPGRPEDELAIDLVWLGRELSRMADAGEYPHDAEERVLNDGALKRSWLVRDAAIGAYTTIDDIERDCIVGTHSRCFGTRPESSNRFAPDKITATEVQADVRRILQSLAAR